MIDKVVHQVKKRTNGALEILEGQSAESVVEKKLRKVPKKSIKTVKFTVKTINKQRKKFKVHKNLKSKKNTANQRLKALKKAKQQAKKATVIAKGRAEQTKKTLKANTAEEVVVEKLKRVPEKSLKVTKASIKTFNTSRKFTTKKKANNNAAKVAWHKKKQKERMATRLLYVTRDMAKSVASGTKKAVRALKAVALLKKVAVITAGAGVGVFALLIAMILVVMMLICTLFFGVPQTKKVENIELSTEVNNYYGTISHYASQYGMSEYISLIQAVMMQESGGKGNDPMQSSEGAFNTKYPKQPNGITDPNYSIECGVQELKEALTLANVKNPVDLDGIRLALQGYNYGTGYISWVYSNHDGKYTYANACEFSDLQAKKLGWSSYGDKNYVEHVLRYYPYGTSLYGKGASKVIEVAITQIDQTGVKFWTYMGFNSAVDWCACFVSWCGGQSGYKDQIPQSSLCMDMAQEFKNRGQWQDRGYTPKIGDIVFFHYNNGTSDRWTNHVGIVEKVDKKIYTIEGNFGYDSCDKTTVKRSSYKIDSSLIVGYGTPNYNQ